MENKIVIQKLIDSPIEKVWEAWTTAENLMQWKAPEGMTCQHADLELREGGEYHITIAGPDQTGRELRVVITGIYRIIEPPNKLSFTWRTENLSEVETTVTIELKSVEPNKTELTLTHEGFTDSNQMTSNNNGWTSTLVKLETFVKTS